MIKDDKKKDQVEPLLDNAAKFIVSVRTYLDENVGLMEDHLKD